MWMSAGGTPAAATAPAEVQHLFDGPDGAALDDHRPLDGLGIRMIRNSNTRAPPRQICPGVLRDTRPTQSVRDPNFLLDFRFSLSAANSRNP